MTRIVWLIVALSIGALTGCGDGISAGYIVRKDYEAEYTTTTMTCVAYKPNGLCQMYSPVTDYHAAQYRLYVRDEAGKKGWVDVDPRTFGRVHVGEHYPDLR